MSALRYWTLDVFTAVRFAGNQLAVVVDADHLDDGEMQAIAAEFGYSETVFLQTPTVTGATLRTRLFTPSRELGFAGHPSIGTAVLWSTVLEAGTNEVVLEQPAGLVRVRVSRAPDGVVSGELTAPQAPVLGPQSPVARAALATVLGLRLADLIDTHRVASCGTPFLIVPVRSIEALGRAELSLPAWRTTCRADPDLRYLYLVADTGSRLQARMFGPDGGIIEDPATGSAAAALAGVLGAGRFDGTHSWTVHQGVEMGRPSVLNVSADVVDGQVVTVRVAGAAVVVMSGSL